MLAIINDKRIKDGYGRFYKILAQPFRKINKSNMIK
jgi:hypothetical protein